MKLYSIAVVNVTDRSAGKLLTMESDLTSFNYFTRANVLEFITFMSKTIAERTDPGVRQSVKQDVYVAHAYSRVDGLAAVAVTDSEYHTRVAISLLSKVLDDFVKQYPQNAWKTAAATPLTELKVYLTKYQNPETADTITKVQKDLDETKEVLINTMDQLLQRGEKLDDLVAKSNDLSFSSKKFYQEAKKQNQCCSIM